MAPFWHHRGTGVNRQGHSKTLQASHPGDMHALKHGANSPRFLQPRADEIAAELMHAPHVVDLDRVGVHQIAAVMAWLEALEAAIEKRGVAKAGSLLEQELSSRRLLLSLLREFGVTPSARADWAGKLGSGGLAGEIARRRTGTDREREPETGTLRSAPMRVGRPVARRLTRSSAGWHSPRRVPLRGRRVKRP